MLDVFSTFVISPRTSCAAVPDSCFGYPALECSICRQGQCNGCKSILMCSSIGSNQANHEKSSNLHLLIEVTRCYNKLISTQYPKRFFKPFIYFKVTSSYNAEFIHNKMIMHIFRYPWRFCLTSNISIIFYIKFAGIVSN